jgi:hypothetical protein
VLDGVYLKRDRAAVFHEAAFRSEPLFPRAQVLAPAKRTEAPFHRSRQTERTLRTPSRDAWREESEVI